MELEAFKLVAQGGGVVAVLVCVWLFRSDSKSTAEKLDRIVADFATRVEKIQAAFIDELRQINRESYDDRRLFQEQIQKTSDKSFALTNDVILAMSEMKNAVRSLEGRMKEIQVVIGQGQGQGQGKSRGKPQGQGDEP